MTDRLGRLLLVKLEAARLKGDLPVLGALHAWLDSWRGIGAVERGMRSRASTSNSRATTTAAGGASFYVTGWSTRRRARRVPDGSARRGMRRSGRRGRASPPPKRPIRINSRDTVTLASGSTPNSGELHYSPPLGTTTLLLRHCAPRETSTRDGGRWSFLKLPKAPAVELHSDYTSERR